MCICFEILKRILLIFRLSTKWPMLSDSTYEQSWEMRVEKRQVGFLRLQDNIHLGWSVNKALWTSFHTPKIACKSTRFPTWIPQHSTSKTMGEHVSILGFRSTHRAIDWRIWAYVKEQYEPAAFGKGWKFSQAQQQWETVGPTNSEVFIVLACAPQVVHLGCINLLGKNLAPVCPSIANLHHSNPFAFSFSSMWLTTTPNQSIKQTRL